MPAAVILTVAAVLALVSTRNIPAGGAIFFTFTALQGIIRGYPAWIIILLLLSAGAFLTASIRTGVFSCRTDTELILWRVFARPFALLFIPLEVYLGKTVLLFIIGSLALVSITTDMFRIFSSFSIKKLYKQGEEKKFSSITAFLVSCFTIFLVFSPPITYLALSFFSMGDLFSKLIGIRFGRIKLLSHRTLEGSLAFFLGSLIAGYIIYLYIPFPEVYLFAGAACAAAIELFSKNVDDNLTVGIFSAVFLSLLRYFLYP